MTNGEVWLDPVSHPHTDPMTIQLARDGYDIWIGNVRGTRYGDKNDQWAWDSFEFWDFSWYEQGLYDIPAMQKYISDMTGKKSSLFGLSQGTSSILASISERPDFHKVYTNVAGL